jgi:DNA-binding transcriptional MerR regulator
MTDDLLSSDPAYAAENSVEIPQKLYFRIGEVSSLIGVEPYVLRYWESEFAGVAPKRSGKGQRLYRRKDVELLLRIKHLLYEKRFTIEGARQLLKTKARRNETAPAQARLFGSDPLPEIRRELSEILGILRRAR